MKNRKKSIRVTFGLFLFFTLAVPVLALAATDGDNQTAADKQEGVGPTNPECTSIATQSNPPPILSTAPVPVPSGDVPEKTVQGH